MFDINVGIGDMAFHLPSAELDLEFLAHHRSSQDQALGRRLRRAMESTGQERLRFPRYWEDAATLAAEAARNLLDRNDADTGRSLRYLAAGTETGVDHSKPLSSYVLGMLKKAGFPISTSLNSYQVQHACASGTLALLGVSAQLAWGKDTDRGLVLCTDIARYPSGSSAEITQGAGAAALLVERNPRLLSLDLAAQGFSSGDEDDFFRPLGSKTAQVKGGYSIRCYYRTLEEALQDFADRKGIGIRELLDESDFLALHSPYYQLPINAFSNLLTRKGWMDTEGARLFLDNKGLTAGLEPIRRVGNLYSGSLYLTLAFLLYRKFRELGDGIIGKKVLICSYGSGNIMSVFQGTLQPGAPEILSRWNLDSLLDQAEPAGLDLYNCWMDEGICRDETPPDRAFHLASIREDGYRQYGLYGRSS